LNIYKLKPVKTVYLINLINKIYRNNKNKIVNTGFVKCKILKIHRSNTLLKKHFKYLKFTS